MAQQINLYSPALLGEKKHFSAATMSQALALLLAAGLAFYVYVYYKTSAFERIAAESARQLKGQSEQLALLMKDFSPQGKSRLLEEEVARSSARLKQLEHLASALQTGGLGNSTGFSRYLAALARQPVNGVWLTDVSIGGDEAQLAMTGRALHADLVPAYVRALSREQVMQGRRISDLRLSAQEEERKAGTQAPGAKPVEPGSTRSRYVQFSLTARRESAAPENPPGRGPASPGAADAAAAFDPAQKNLKGSK